MSNPVLEESNTNTNPNTEWSRARGDLDSIEIAAKKLSKPLWVIAICSAIVTVLAVLVLAYAGYTAIAVNQAMNDFSEEWNSETTDAPGTESEEVPSDEPS